jgi:hypothetical protein
MRMVGGNDTRAAQPLTSERNPGAVRVSNTVMKSSWKRSLIASVAALIGTSATAHAQTPADSAARQRLQQRQLEDSLRLGTQQAVPPRSTLSPSDARRLDDLQLRQRVEQGRLDQQQLMLEQRRARNPDALGLETQQRLLDQERELQLQRFQLEQQDLLRKAKPRPLQRRPPDGALEP